MKQKRHPTEELIRILREADAGKDLEAVCRQHNISAASFYRWKKKFGGTERKDARKYRHLDKEHAELKQTLADSLLKVRVLEEVNAKKWWALRTSGVRSPRRWSRPDCARSEGPVGTWDCIVPATATYPGRPRTGCCICTPRSRDSPVSTLAWATASACACCAARAGRWDASKVQRIRGGREHGLRVKRWTQRPRRRGCSTGTIPTRAEWVNQVWSWDFISDRTDNGGKLRVLSILDEYSRECLALHVARQLTAPDLIEVMEKLVT